MLSHVQGAVVVRCCRRRFCTGSCVCLRFTGDPWGCPGVSQPRWAPSRARLRRGGADVTSGRGDTEGQRCHLLPLPSLLPAEAAGALSSCRNLVGTPEWGVTGYTNTATMVNSSCWICSTWIDAVAFYSRVNANHSQFHMVASSPV